MAASRFDLAVVGMGSAGMTAAEFAADLGLRVVAVERDRVGGDCLWTGCVPSKALLAAARVAHLARHGAQWGLPATDAPIDRRAVWAAVRHVRDEVAAGDDDPARFVALGIDLRFGAARITGPGQIAITPAAGGPVEGVSAAHVLVCTGSRPRVPDVPGLADAGFVSSETIFELDEVPSRLVFLGGGPIAVELAQACARLGCAVTVLQRREVLLPRDEPELVAQLTDVLRGEGVDVRLGVDVRRVEPGPVVVGAIAGVEHRWPAGAIVVAAGRRPNVDGLGLDALGVLVEGGVAVDEWTRTAAPWLSAAGDVVAGGDRFTHAAAYQAVRAVRNAALPGRGRAHAPIPWATFTDPELAHAGLTTTEAIARFGAARVDVHRWSLERNDRAHAERAGGMIVLVEHRRPTARRLVGAHVLAPAAGELIGELALAIEARRSVASLGGVVHVYPTIATSVQQLGGRAALARAARYRWLVRAGRLRRLAAAVGDGRR